MFGLQQKFCFALMQLVASYRLSMFGLQPTPSHGGGFPQPLLPLEHVRVATQGGDGYSGERHGLPLEHVRVATVREMVR